MSDKSAEDMTISDLWHQLTLMNDWLKANMPDASVVTEGDTATATLWTLDKLEAEVERLRAELMHINDRATVWENREINSGWDSIETERKRWILLGQLAYKALQGEQP